MSKLIGVRLNKSRQEKLAILYKLYQCNSEKDSERFRELLDKVYSEKTSHSDTSTISTNQHPELDLLEGWDCVFRVLIHPYNKYSKKKEPMIFCLNPNTREIVKSNEIFIEVCKKCHDTKGSIKPLELPEPKKPTPKPQSKKSKRQCVDCGSDISRLEDWKTRCLDCWRIEQVRKSKGDYDGKPLPGSPADIGTKSGARTRRADETFKQSKEE